jgi:trans-aconitate methyltransferase
MILFLLLFESALSVFGLLFLLVMIESLIRGHDLPTDSKTTRSICKIISEYNPQASNFYDLGCARGALAIRIKKRFPRLLVHGVDNSSIRIACAKLRALLVRSNIGFVRANIFDVDLGNADIVYTYLWYDTMPLLEKKLQKELKRGALIIANTSHFPNLEPIKQIKTLFVYRKT